MRILDRLQQVETLPGLSEYGAAISIGTFDGVHIGHRQILQSMSGHAATSGQVSLAVTFDPHPLSVIRPENAPPLLDGIRQRLDRIAGLGVENALVLPFDNNLARMEAPQFVLEILLGKLFMKDLFIGENFTFGRGGSGNPALLREMCAGNHFRVHVFTPIQCNEEIISSTVIRRAVHEGDLAKAARYLGRPYSLSGRVEQGQKLGRTLGFPTANIRVSGQQVLPPRGVYAARAGLDGDFFAGAANLGLRPTVDGKRLSLEVHLFDFDGDIYGRELEISLIKFLRPERQFASLSELGAQIKKDADQARIVARRYPAVIKSKK